MPPASPHKKQIAEREPGEELGAVSGETAVVDVHMAKLAFDDTERMLYLGLHLGDNAVGAFLRWLQGAAPRSLKHDTQN